MLFEMIMDAVFTAVSYTGFFILMGKLIGRISESFADDWGEEE